MFVGVVRVLSSYNNISHVNDSPRKWPYDFHTAKPWWRDNERTGGNYAPFYCQTAVPEDVDVRRSEQQQMQYADEPDY